MRAGNTPPREGVEAVDFSLFFFFRLPTLRSLAIRHGSGFYPPSADVAAGDLRTDAVDVLFELIRGQLAEVCHRGVVPSRSHGSSSAVGKEERRSG